MICREHYRLRLTLPAHFPSTQPGQFVQLGCRDPHLLASDEDIAGREIEWAPGQTWHPTQPEVCDRVALLRRPFSLAGHDEDAHTIDIIHRVVGTGTHWLAQLQPDQAVDLIGPLGNQFDLPADKNFGLLVGGGVGLPPMFYLAQALQKAGWQGIGFVGAMSRDLLAVTLDDSKLPNDPKQPGDAIREFAEAGIQSIITTDDGSLGLQGRITLGLECWLADADRARLDKTVIYTCGPEPMMHAVADLAEKYNIDCQVCLEQAMACGMGTCQSCIVKIDPTLHPEGGDPRGPYGQVNGRAWRYKLACTDGPVFPAQAVVW